MLKMVRLCMHQHPGLFGEGEGAIVGPFLLALVPALAEPRLACLHDQIVKTINDFMDLTVVDRCVAPCSFSCYLVPSVSKLGIARRSCILCRCALPSLC
jgi:hypothetical protein